MKIKKNKINKTIKGNGLIKARKASWNAFNINIIYLILFLQIVLV